jgi:tetratricopeptide (TPR) repeat protein
LASSKKYRAFLSYSHADAKWAGWLHKALEAYRPPKNLTPRGHPNPLNRRLSPIFMDRDELASSSNLSEHINEALEASEALIVVCSPAARKSHWVCEEIRTFQALGRGNRIFCLIVAGDPVRVDSEDDCFPAPLRLRCDEQGKYLDQVVEPVAADLRAGRDGKTLAKLKVIAGLMDVDLDVLRQREIHRRQRRMIGLTAASTAAAGIMAFLALNATSARYEAEQRRLQSEDLLSFMIGDLRESLTPLGRLDLLESVSERAMNYFNTVDLDRLSDDELLVQTTVITQLGQVRFEQLEYESALQAFNEAYTRSALLQSKRPGDGTRLFNRGQAEFWVGYVYWMQGDLAGAEQWLSRYLQSSLELAQLDPDKHDWQMEIAYGHHNLGALAQEQDSFDLAENHFTSALSIYQVQQGVAGADSFKSEIADLISYRGDIALLRGDLQKALSHYKDSLDLHRSHSGEDEENLERKNYLASALYLTGSSYSYLGNFEAAHVLLDESVHIRQKLIDNDPTNMSWRSQNASALIDVAALHLSSMDRKAAERALSRALKEVEILRVNQNRDRYVLGAMAGARSLQAELSLLDGKPAESLNHLIAARNWLVEIRSSGDTSAILEGRIATIYLRIALVHLIMDKRVLADHAKRKARETLELKLAQKSRSHFIMDPWARYLYLEGRDSEANAVVASLDASGYKPLEPWQH